MTRIKKFKEKHTSQLRNKIEIEKTAIEEILQNFIIFIQNDFLHICLVHEFVSYAINQEKVILRRIWR